MQTSELTDTQRRELIDVIKSKLAYHHGASPGSVSDAIDLEFPTVENDCCICRVSVGSGQSLPDPWAMGIVDTPHYRRISPHDVYTDVDASIRARMVALGRNYAAYWDSINCETVAFYVTEI